MATIEIDGKTLEVDSGKMIIEAADDAGIYIPRFCYHKKLSVAANCRMCLVEISNVKKPVPACATPITDGMKVYTKSEEAIRSQKAVMEFLLINHPLDCPICDQGGECELQDVSMGFGSESSEYQDIKRSVNDGNLGSLVATEMTRCIHCTRCVRFGSEVAGLRELGATGRGEKTQIGTYVEHSMVSEVSGNIIDLCPVGALTAKPSRYTGRSWEMVQHKSIAAHDCVGSNIYLHTRREELMRVVPKDNEAVNECWISDRDRFSYAGIGSKQRLQKPMIRQNGQWKEVEWEAALKHTAEQLTKVIKQYGPEQVAGFAHPSSTTEEMYLMQKLFRAMKVNNLDHRIHQTDFRDQSALKLTTANSKAFHHIEQAKAILVFGCNLPREAPVASIRVRKAAKKGAKLYSMNPLQMNMRSSYEHEWLVAPAELPATLAKVLAAVAKKAPSQDASIARLIVGIEPDTHASALAKQLISGEAAIVTGELLDNHPEAALMRYMLDWLITQTHSAHYHFTAGANTAGAWYAGMLPHRTAGGRAIESVGLDIQSALASKLKAYVLMGIEPGYDLNNSRVALQSLLGAELVVMITSFADDAMMDYADILLPMAVFSETSGTYVNLDDVWQSFRGAQRPVGGARPAWKIFRVLGNLIDIPGFEYSSSEDVLQELRTQIQTQADSLETRWTPDALPVVEHAIQRLGEWPVYRVDSIVRRSEPLQLAGSADRLVIRLHPNTAQKHRISDFATVSQGDIEIRLPVELSAEIAEDVAWIPHGYSETADLGLSFADIQIK